MYLDKLLMFDESDAAITASTASTNIVDLGAADLGKTGGMEFFVQVTEAFNNADSLAIKAQTASNAAFSVPIDLPVQETHLLSNSGLTLNSQLFKVPVPMGVKQYLRLYYTVAGTPPSTGKIRAGLVTNLQTNP